MSDETAKAAPSGTSANLAGDLWGGLAAMLVALPSAIAYGVAAYAPLGAGYAASGAMAGILGAIAIGLVAPLFGGAPRLISSPCAPAAAVMGGLATNLLAGARGGAARPEDVLLLMTLVGLLSGGLQVVYGAVGGGRLIKYIPYPVVSGYLSGVGMIIILGQLPKFFGFPKEPGLMHGVLSPDSWRWQGLAVGIVAMAVMLASPKLTKRVPAAILALLGGLLAYWGLSFAFPELLVLEHNKLVVGTVGGGGGSFLGGLMERWTAIGALNLSDVRALLQPAITLSVLLSIDTLKTCVVMDALTESRHNSNRELVGQGLGNLASACIGGMPGAGTMGASLVNLTSGATTRLSGVIEGVLVLAALLLMGKLIAWVPVAALAGILMVVGFRMVDRTSLHLLKHASTLLDFVVIATVVFVAVAFSLIAASGVGLGLAILLFIRDQIRTRVLRRKSYGHQVSSKRRRLPSELEIIERKGRQVLICELQGNLFFGTTDQFLVEIEPDLEAARYIVLDMARVHSLDFTTAHLLEQIQARLARKSGRLIFTSIHGILPTGQDLKTYFRQLGLVSHSQEAQVFQDLDEGIEWVEDRILQEEGALQDVSEKPLDLREFELLNGLSEETLMELGAILFSESYQPGQKIFEHGKPAGEVYLLRRGMVKIFLPGDGERMIHLATFARGDFFGDLSFLQPGIHSADAVAVTPTEVFYVSRDVFDVIAQDHHRMGTQFFTRLSETLGKRLRRTDVELRALRQG